MATATAREAVLSRGGGGVGFGTSGGREGQQGCIIFVHLHTFYCIIANEDGGREGGRDEGY